MSMYNGSTRFNIIISNSSVILLFYFVLFSFTQFFLHCFMVKWFLRNGINFLTIIDRFAKNHHHILKLSLILTLKWTRRQCVWLERRMKS